MAYLPIAHNAKLLFCASYCQPSTVWSDVGKK